MLILNELKYAQKIIETNQYDDKITTVLNVLSKYYLHYMKYDENRVLELLDQFLEASDPSYVSVKWRELLKKTIAYANKSNFLEIDYIPITKSEIDVINTLELKQSQRLAFTLLSFAKAYNLINPNNNNWVNVKQKEIFASAHISSKSIREQNSMLHDLFKLGLISFSKKISNLNIQVNFISEDTDIVWKINDFRDLGYEFLLYKGDKYIYCEKCNRLTKDNIYGNKKYCSPCAKYEVAKSNMKTLICNDCKKEYLVYNKNTKSDRCYECYEVYRKDRKSEKQRIRRENNRLKSDQIKEEHPSNPVESTVTAVTGDFIL